MNWITENKDLIEIIAGLGTFISALIALFTLIEVKKQRQSTYKPELVIKSFIIAPSKSPLRLNLDELLAYKVSDFNDYSSNFNEVPFQITPIYRVDNFGFGIAKNVKCTWKFDIKKAISLIEKALDNSYRINNHHNYYFLEHLKKQEFHYSSNQQINSDDTDYIAPISIQKNHDYHSVPGIIIFSHLLYLIFKEKLQGENPKQFYVFEFDEFPKPCIYIEYFDLNNKKYSKTMTFEVAAVSSQTAENIDMNKEFCMLQFNL